MTVYKINGKDYFKANDLIELGHRRLKECDNDFDAFCDKYQLIDGCIYANYDEQRDKWIQNSGYDKAEDKTFIRTNAINGLGRRETDPLPKLVKFKSVNSPVDKSSILIEVRIDGEPYFKIKDVGRYLCVANLEEMIETQDRYVTDIHYEPFWDAKMEEWVMFLTCKGFLDVIDEYQPHISAHTLEWINEITLSDQTEIERMTSLLEKRDQELEQLKKTLSMQDIELEEMRLSLRRKCLELVIKQAELEIKDIDLKAKK